MSNFYVITPSNRVIGPCASVAEAQSEIPDSHNHKVDTTTDVKACRANLVGAHPKLQDADIEHLETWCRENSEDSDEGYLVFKAD